MSESVVLCEGYYDRAFWAGWLECLGCTDPGRPEAKGKRRKAVYDPWHTIVSKGQFAYHSKSDGSIRVQPCKGKNNIVPAARIRLDEAGSKPLARLVICVDSDADSRALATNAEPPSVQSTEQLVRRFDANARKTSEGNWLLWDGETTVSTVCWKASDAPGEGLPVSQTLERLACAAIVAAYPKRAPAVQKWLDSRPAAPPEGPKEYAWSYLAGWYAEGGAEFFYRGLWGDEAIAKELESRLRRSGAWDVAEALAR